MSRTRLCFDKKKGNPCFKLLVGDVFVGCKSPNHFAFIREFTLSQFKLPGFILVVIFSCIKSRQPGD